jgi:uncharacterized protein YraI
MGGTMENIMMLPRRLGLVLIRLVLGIAVIGQPVYSGILAQDALDGVTDYQVNMRAGPGVDYAVITTLPAATGLIFEARNSDMSWLLGQTPDSTFRGWVAALYLSYGAGFSAARLPVSDEIVVAQAAGSVSQPVDASTIGNEAAFLGLGADGDLGAIPVISGVGPYLKHVFALGQALGNDPRVFTQVGECNTMAQTFMVPFATGVYDLGAHASLQATIDYKGLAMQTGFTSQAAIDPALADPRICAPDQSLLECEYARVRPSVALINLGLYDVYWLSPDQYEEAMRRIVDISISQGVIPVLTTIPTCPGDTGNWPNEAGVRVQNRVRYNNIVVNLSREYQVPLLNLWRATQPLPDCGLKSLEDHQHLSESADRTTWAAFTGQEQRWGFTMWNLVALQMLDTLRTQVLTG